MKILHLHLKTPYFNQIKDGSKGDEFRLNTEYWRKRLIGQSYDEIRIYQGYQKRGDESLVLKRKWNGARLTEIAHPEFGPDPVDVFAIDVTKEVEAETMMPLSKDRLKEIGEELTKNGLSPNKAGLKTVLTKEEFAAACERKKFMGFNCLVSALVIERKSWEEEERERYGSK